jgi:hypothetical protein
METHIIKIDTWELIKGIFGVMWLMLKMLWPYFLAAILIKVFFSWLESRIKKGKIK